MDGKGQWSVKREESTPNSRGFFHPVTLRGSSQSREFRKDAVHCIAIFKNPGQGEAYGGKPKSELTVDTGELFLFVSICVWNESLPLVMVKWQISASCGSKSLELEIHKTAGG